jgi:hypothetical protein
MNAPFLATPEIRGSNSLADLAARIKIEHEATADSLKSSVEHAMAAGDLLIEAKAQLKHGQWLPWLTEHCAMSERTAQLYMRTAKNRATIEIHIRNGVADLNLNQAAALLMLTSDVRKLFNFARDIDGLSGDALIERCIAEGVGVIQDSGYNMFAGRNEAEIVEWQLFALFLSYDAAAGRGGGEPQRVADHVEYLLQRPFQNVAEWLGPEGDKWRKNPFNGGSVSEQFKTDWAAFLAKHRHRGLADVIRELETLQQRFNEAEAEGKLPPVINRTRRKRLRLAR